MRELGGQDVAVVGAPLRRRHDLSLRAPASGRRRCARSPALGSGYNFETGVDLLESLDIVDVGDVSVIPANIEKSFDQIDKAVAYIHERAVFPVVLGGDHSIGYPDVRGLAPYVDGNIGIIHFDRHTDLSEYNLDERMHGTPFFHATNIPNAPPTNLVQIGIGGWTGSRAGVRVARERRATVITIDRHRPLGVGAGRGDGAGDRLEERQGGLPLLRHRLASTPAFAPGTGTPESGGLTAARGVPDAPTSSRARGWPGWRWSRSRRPTTSATSPRCSACG